MSAAVSLGGIFDSFASMEAPTPSRQDSDDSSFVDSLFDEPRSGTMALLDDLLPEYYNGDIHVLEDGIAHIEAQFDDPCDHIQKDAPRAHQPLQEHHLQEQEEVQMGFVLDVVEGLAPSVSQSPANSTLDFVVESPSADIMLVESHVDALDSIAASPLQVQKDDLSHRKEKCRSSHNPNIQNAVHEKPNEDRLQQPEESIVSPSSSPVPSYICQQQSGQPISTQGSMNEAAHPSSSDHHYPVIVTASAGKKPLSRRKQELVEVIQNMLPRSRLQGVVDILSKKQQGQSQEAGTVPAVTGGSNKYLNSQGISQTFVLDLTSVDSTTMTKLERFVNSSMGWQNLPKRKPTGPRKLSRSVSKKTNKSVKDFFKVEQIMTIHHEDDDEVIDIEL